MIECKYIYSACIITKTKDVSVLHDPWFTDGAFDGSWFTFPKIDNPVDYLGDVDFIYISHIHPDHYDPIFLQKYFIKYGSKPILIADFPNNYLLKKMQADGFYPDIVKADGKIIGNTAIFINPHLSDSDSDIDSFFIMEYRANDRCHRILNLNDCDGSLNLSSFKNFRQLDYDILFCGYTDASPYPQCYFNHNDRILPDEIKRRKKIKIENFVNFINFFNPKIAIPFAGEYLLGGKLINKNKYRGVIDAAEVKKYAQNINVKALNSGSSIDTILLKPTSEKTTPYSKYAIDERLKEIKNYKFKYNQIFVKKNLDLIPLNRMLVKSFFNAIKRSEINFDYYYFLYFNNGIFCFNINSKKNEFYFDKVTNTNNYTEIFLDRDLLLCLLVGVNHWNNTITGSHLKIRRYPNYAKLHLGCIFSSEENRKINDFLNFFTLV